MNEPPISLADSRALVATPLWPRVRAFLWNFASLCDPARLVAALSGGDGTLVTRHSSLVTAEGLLGSPRAARAAEQALGLSPFFHDFPASDGSRLLLLSREDYDRLAQFLGVVALAPALRRVTSGADVRALRAALPGVYPEALAFTPYFHRFERLFETVRRGPDSSEPAEPVRRGPNSSEPAEPVRRGPESSEPAEPVRRGPDSSGPAAVSAAGHGLLAAALSSLPSPLLLRQRLRFPDGSPADAALANLGSASVPEAQASGPQPLAAANLALKLSNPQEYKACFS